MEEKPTMTDINLDKILSTPQEVPYSVLLETHTICNYCFEELTYKYSGENKYLIHCRFCKFSYLQSM